MSSSLSSRVSNLGPNSASSEVSGPYLLGIRRTGDDRQNELIDAMMGCFRAHVCLIFLRVLSVERSKSVLADIILSLPGDLPGYIGGLLRYLEAKLAQWSKAVSRKPKAEAELQVLKEKLNGGIPSAWNDSWWGYREAAIIRDLTW